MLNADVKTVLKGLIDFGEEIDRSLVDGWQWKDSLNFFDELFSVPAITKAVPGAIKAIKALSEDDRNEAIQFVKDELDIANDHSEAIIEGAFKLILQMADFVSLFKKKADGTMAFSGGDHPTTPPPNG